MVVGLIAGVPGGSASHVAAAIGGAVLAMAVVPVLASGRGEPPSRARSVVGLCCLAVALFLLPWASYVLSVLVVAVLAGAACGLLLPRRRVRDAVLLFGVAGGGLAMLANAFVGALLPSVVALGLLGTVVPRGGGVPRRRRGIALGGAVVIGTFAAAGCVGSTSPTVPWFGAVVVHGPREQAAVALTFDDGPNETATLEVARILEEHGTRGTFFEVGRAVQERPEITRALVERGHIVGNHSFTHGQWDYLDPRYPELDETQRAIREVAGVCPALFRPPHGNRTPLLSWLVERDGLRLVSWDVSASDWAATDAERLAATVVERARAGSIILLHDGLDGDPSVDRTVLVRALPAILDGLRAKGLEVVSLDRLIGGPAYLPAC